MHGNNGSGAMAALGGYVGAGTMQGAVNRPTPPVHNAQEMLDKAVASLLNEVDMIHNALTPVLTVEPSNTPKDSGAPTSNNTVASRIVASAGAVANAAAVLMDIRRRLEV